MCIRDRPSSNKQGLPSDFSQLMDRSGTLPGSVFEAWPIAYEAFLKQKYLSAEQKKLKHYRVGFKQIEDRITVLFRPLMLPQLVDGEVVGMMRASYGKEVRVSVDMSRRSVQDVVFGR